MSFIMLRFRMFLRKSSFAKCLLYCFDEKGSKKLRQYENTAAVLARLKGLEPLTYWFVASHSIQLSYKRN